MNTYLIQAGVSILTATIVALITMFFNNKKYYQQKWWMKKATKYETVLVTLAKLKRIYDELNYQTGDGSNMNHKKYPTFFELKTKLRIEMLTANFYMDTGSVKLLEKLVDRFSVEAEEFGTCIDNDLIYPTLKLLEDVIAKMIYNAKKELNGM